MFWTAEDVAPAAKAIQETFGPQGNMMEKKGVTKNVIIGIPKFGKVWYGDVDGNLEYVQGLCALLSTRLKEKVLIVDEGF